MSTSRPCSTSVACVAILASALLAGTVEAGSYGRQFIQNPVSNCQAALPVFEGQIRKRPKAIQNEGVAIAFVTCSWMSQGTNGVGAGQNPKYLAVRFSVPDGVARTVSCTVVPGGHGNNLASLTTTLTINAGPYQTMSWTPQSFGRTDEFPHGLVSVSCAIPPGMAINDSVLSFDEPVP